MIENMKRGTKILLASGFAAVVAAACMVTYSIPSPQARDAAARIEASVTEYRGGREGPEGPAGEASPRLFASAYQRVQSAYVRPTEDAELIAAAETGMREAYPDPSVATDADLYAAAIQGMLGSLDDYSVYMDTVAFNKLNQEIEGEFGGLGVEIKKDPLGLEVISPIDDTPAMRAGLRPGDRLTHADGVSLAEMSLRETVELLRGPPGTTVTVTVLRGEEPTFEVPLTREIIQIQRVRARLEGDVGYLRISHFLRDTGLVLRQEMGALRAQAGPGGLTGYVLDLRSNPGGLLSESIDVAGTFLSGGLVVSTRSRTHEERFSADLADPSQDLPVVVLINEGSASASEIVAGAIKYRERGLVVGQRSFGKGSVQTTFPFNGGGGLKLTTALYYTPGGKTVEGGIEPNIEAIDDPETEEVDEALEVALELVRSMSGDQALHARDPDGSLAQ
jgi:carboxyl-terminal processing protease